MNNNLIYKYILLFTLSFTILSAQEEYDYIDANEIFMWIGNNGSSARDPIDDDSGLFWPGGSNATIAASFADGIVWDGKVNGEIRVGGSTYRYGLTPGLILKDVKQSSPSVNYARIFNLKSGWENLINKKEKENFEIDYKFWPGQHGAPYEDVNWDKQFSPGIDKPKILGDQTLFYVANDLDEERTRFLYGSPPLSLEFQQTLFAYNTPELKDAVFKRIRLINKGDDKIDSMYIGYWADDDLGFGGDDYSGCDTNLNLGYSYNSDNNDDDWYMTNPPAIGRVLLKGPESNKRNLPMTSFMWYINAHPRYQLPYLGKYEGSLQQYSNLKGKLYNGDPIIDPNTGDTTTYCVSGDPVNNTGWNQNGGWPGGDGPGNIFYLLSSGPFTMEPGDTQEVAFAIFLARGSSNINSITKLKEKANHLHNFWKEFVLEEIEERNNQVVKEFKVYQNYPNPFNPTTTIEYRIPGQARNDMVNVKLIIYDVLGREVTTLVDERQMPGKYWMKFDGTNYASSIYFYRLSINDFTKTNKMILLR